MWEHLGDGWERLPPLFSQKTLFQDVNPHMVQRATSPQFVFQESRVGLPVHTSIGRHTGKTKQDRCRRDTSDAAAGQNLDS